MLPLLDKESTKMHKFSGGGYCTICGTYSNLPNKSSGYCKDHILIGTIISGAFTMGGTMEDTGVKYCCLCGVEEDETNLKTDGIWFECNKCYNSDSSKLK